MRLICFNINAQWKQETLLKDFEGRNLICMRKVLSHIEKKILKYLKRKEKEGIFTEHNNKNNF